MFQTGKDCAYCSVSRAKKLGVGVGVEGRSYGDGEGDVVMLDNLVAEFRVP